MMQLPTPQEQDILERGEYSPIGPYIDGSGPPAFWYGWQADWRKGAGPCYVANIAGNYYKAEIRSRPNGNGYDAHYWHIEMCGL